MAQARARRRVTRKGLVVMKFKARIKEGTSIGIDMGWCRWPLDHWSVGRRVPNPDMEFEAEMLSLTLISLVAPGFGAKGDYRNGSILVSSLGGLIISDEARAHIIAIVRREKEKQITETVEKLTGLKNELDAIA